MSELVDFFWIYDGYGPAHSLERLLPTGTMELIFTMDADRRVTCGVAGPRSESLVLDTSQPFSAIAVHFRTGGGFPFFGVPSSELHNRTATLDLMWGSDATAISDRLWESTDSAERFRILEQTLLRKGRGRFGGHPAVRYALDAFGRSNGTRAVGDVVQRIGLSAKRFADVFRSEVGLTPKAFCRIRRFNEVLRRIESLTDVDWADVALSCGYFDQAHFNHDFREFAGLTPSNYLRQRISRTHVALTD